MLTIVRLVNITCHRLGIGLKHEPDLVLMASAEARALDITDTQIVELEAVLEEARETSMDGEQHGE
jgi:hypothetical protein